MCVAVVVRYCSAVVRWRLLGVAQANLLVLPSGTIKKNKAVFQLLTLTSIIEVLLY